MKSLLQDARYAWRLLAKSPGLVAAAVITLALGIGANTALFSVVKGVMLDSLPYRQPERLVAIAATDSQTLNPTNVSFNLVQDWKQRQHSFSSIALYRGWSAILAGEAKPERLRAGRVSADFFPTLGVTPILGRGFSPEEDKPGAWHVVLLSHEYWREKFAGRADVIGKTIVLDQTPFQIVGVLPETFQPLIFSYFDSPPQIWSLLGYAPEQEDSCRSCQHLRAVGRLAGGVSLSQARAEMNAISAQLDREYPNDYSKDQTALITPLRDRVVQNVRLALWLLLGATAFVLLIACANVANLLLARAAGRRREMAIRAALGAGRGRLARQLLTESLFLTFLGGMGGILLAAWGVNALISLGPPGIPRLSEIRLDWEVLAFTCLVCISAGVLAGLAPALQAARTDQREALQEAGRGSGSLHRGRMRSVLIVSEIALAFVLTVGTGLLLKSLTRVMGVDAGFDTRDLHSLYLALVGSKYDKSADVARFEGQVVDAIRAIPGIDHAAIVNIVPLAGDWDRRGFHIQDRPLRSDSDAPSVDSDFVSADYFATMGIRILRGRAFTDADADSATTNPVAIVSETTAREMWPGEDAIGKRIQLGGRDEKKPWATIVGISGDVHQFTLDSAITPEAYLLYSQNPNSLATLIVRSELPTEVISRAVQEKIEAMDKTVPVYGATSMDEIIGSSVMQRRFTGTLVGGFGILALALSAIGIYGVMAYHVAQRTNEIGIRVALGASSANVLGLVVRESAILAACGIGVGIPASLVLGQLAASQLFHVRAGDPAILALAAAIVAIGMVLATVIPARRATQVDPIVALRHE